MDQLASSGFPLHGLPPSSPSYVDTSYTCYLIFHFGEVSFDHRVDVLVVDLHFMRYYVIFIIHGVSVLSLVICI